MYKSKKILAIIPARGGSKGLRKKNILPLLGKPLIGWTIEQAFSSKYLDKIIVSTDDMIMAEVARKYGAAIPFMRPAELATDSAKAIDVCIHALDFMSKNGAVFDYVALLEPTSPLREATDIDKCIQLLIGNPRAKTIVSVSKLEGTHPEFNVVIDSNTGFIRKVDGSPFNPLRRQELQPIYFFNGTIYLSEVETLLLKKTFYHELTLGYIVPRVKSLEIDELQDLICAEALLTAKLKGDISF